MRPHSSSHEGAPSHEPSSSLPMPSAENISSPVSCSDYRTLLPLHLASHKLLRGARAPPARRSSVIMRPQSGLMNEPSGSGTCASFSHSHSSNCMLTDRQSSEFLLWLHSCEAADFLIDCAAKLSAQLIITGGGWQSRRGRVRGGPSRRAGPTGDCQDMPSHAPQMQLYMGATFTAYATTTLRAG
jgi:hypothetical protein